MTTIQQVNKTHKYTVLSFVVYLQGLKTGMYYLRTKPAANAIQFTVDKTKLQQGTSGTKEKTSGTQNSQEQNMAAMMCSLENKEDCLMCGS